MPPPIVALVNAKGGSGATTIAIEVAKALGQSGNVAVIDGDLSGRRSFAVVLDCARRFDDARLPGQPSVITVPGLGNVTAVELVDDLDASYSLGAAAIGALIGSLSKHLSIVADLPQPFAGAVREIIARASVVYVVLEPNLLGSSAARATLGELTRFGVPAARIALVTNLRSKQSSISSLELQKVLGMPVAAEIPMRDDRRYARAIDTFAQRIAATAPLGRTELRRASQASSTTIFTDRRFDRREDGGTGPSLGRRAVDSGAPAVAGLPVAGLPDAAAPARNGARARDASDDRDRLKAEIHEQLSKRIDHVITSRAHTDVQKMAELRAQVSEIAESVLATHNELTSAELAEVRREVIDETLGLGPLEDLMRDEAVTEIMVNGHDKIYIERKGKLERTQKQFVDDRQLRIIIERIIAPLGRRIDEAQPMVDARLPDGSRVNAIIEPLALNGATVTIRRFGKRRLTMDDLVELKAVSPFMVNFLRAAIEARLNIVVSGGTGSGKTTFLNVLSAFLPNDERIVTIEDAAELLLKQDHVVRLEARPANFEGKGEIRIRDLVRNALRMRPDRIIVGECRGGEALDMLQAMNTGHDGSLTTVHANTPRDALSRLETLVLMAGFDLPIRAIREQIASAVDLIVQTARIRDGSRKIVSISEVVGMEGDIVTMQEIVRYKQAGLNREGGLLGEFQFTGAQPQCVQRFEEMGIAFDVRDLAKLASASTLWQ